MKKMSMNVRVDSNKYPQRLAGFRPDYLSLDSPKGMISIDRDSKGRPCCMQGRLENNRGTRVAESRVNKMPISFTNVHIKTGMRTQGLADNIGDGLGSLLLYESADKLQLVMQQLIVLCIEVFLDGRSDK